MSGFSRFVFRCDSSLELGAGHLFRCLVLARELVRRGLEVSFVCRDLEGAQMSRVKGAGLDLVVLPGNLSQSQERQFVSSHAHSRCADWIVFDRYAASAR